ncbi:MAG: hypothetical protein GAK43_00901 [Stenotrophomonas maltophilia]|nr:MAG: hypothetical protein GAK43_00901 [Stenotrophomonas maltophilia]
MKKLVALFCAALMLSAPLASFAQPGPDNGPGNQQGQNGRPGNSGPGQNARPNNNGGPGQNGRPQQGGQHSQRPQQGHSQAYRNPGYRPQAGMPVPHQQWHRGGVVQPIYRGDRYWVTDWRARQLPAPPRDHRWLYVNGDYVLAAVATGVIVQILSGY